MGTWRILREPTVPILLLASVMHVVRRNLFDFLLFFGTAVLILADAQRRPAAAPQVAPGSAAPARRHLPLWVRVAGMTLFAVCAALARPASWGAVLVLAIVGIMVALITVLAGHGPTPEGDSTSHGAPAEGISNRRSPAGWPVWAALGVGACLWELASFIGQQLWPADQADHPAASDLIGPLLDTWLGRALFLLLWAGAGWWLLTHLLGGRHGLQAEHPTALEGPELSQRESGR